LAKIEVAKRNLEDALAAIEELRRTAEENKMELAAAIERLSEARTERLLAEKELQVVRSIAQNDVAVFQKLAGVLQRLTLPKSASLASCLACWRPSRPPVFGGWLLAFGHCSSLKRMQSAERPNTIDTDVIATGFTCLCAASHLRR
jgi:hypothetical protein